MNISDRRSQSTAASLFQAVFMLLIFQASSVHAQNQQFLYVSNWDPSSNSISGFAVDSTTGLLMPLTGFPISAGGHPYKSAVTPNNKFLYIANQDSGVFVYSINPSTGGLTLLTGSPFAPASGSLILHPSGKFLYVAQSTDISVGYVYAFAVDAPSGALSAVPGSPFAAQGNGGPGSLTIDPAGKFLFTPNIRSSTVTVYSIDQTTGALTLVPGSPFLTPISSGLGFGTTDPTGRFFYLTDSYQNTVDAWTIGPTGSLTSIPGSPFPTGPYTGQATAYPTSVAVDRNGKFAYVTNEAASTIAIFQIDSSSGALNPISGSPFSTGSVLGPEAFTFSPEGTFAYVANQKSGSASLYSVNSSTGVLTQVPNATFPTGTQPVAMAIVNGGPPPAVSPSSGGNTGTVTVQINGVDFLLGVQIKLAAVGQPDIIATNINLVNSAAVLASFNLTGAVLGPRDIVITNPGQSAITLPSAFTVLQGQGPQISVNILGPSKVRAGTAAFYYISVTNSGLIDSSPASALVSVPEGASISTGLPLLTAPGVGPTGLPQSVDTGQEVILGTIIPDVPALSTVTLPVTITFPTGGSVAMVSATHVSCGTSSSRPDISAGGQSSAPWNQPFVNARIWLNQNICGGPGPCWTAILGLAPGASCLMNNVCLLTNAAAGEWINFWWYTAWAGISCEPGGIIGEVIANAMSILVSCPGGDAEQDMSVQTVSSLDPNSKQGPIGVGAANFVAGGTLPYAISFENAQTATAPAATVVITDALDPSKVDLNTVTPGPISLAGQVITPPAVPLLVSPLSTTFDLRPDTDLLVQVGATVSSSTPIMTWTWTSIDPATGLPPADPLAGFLPPGSSASLSYTVHPTSATTTGTVIQNTAAVVFDLNPPINTPTWSNTIDNMPPVSHITPFAKPYGCLDFKVSWSGTDVGSGIQDYTIYVSDTGGPFAAWLSKTPVASATYQGQAGHSYGFYSIARDRAGNVEAAKTAPEASIQASTKCGGPPDLTGAATVQPTSATSVTVSLQITNSGTESAYNVVITKVVPRVLSGAGKVSFSSPTLPIPVGNLAAGASATVSLVFAIPSSVNLVGIAEGGTVQDAQSKTYAYTLGQEVQR